MARLPVPGQDEGTWGDLLNEYLEVAHNEDGTINTVQLEEDFQKVGAVLALSDYEMTGEERFVLCLTGNLTLPDASTIEGQEITVIAAGATLTIATISGQSIGGQPSITALQGSTVKLTALDGSPLGAGWGWSTHSYTGPQFDLPQWFGQSIQDGSVVQMVSGVPQWAELGEDAIQNTSDVINGLKNLELEKNEPALVLRCDGTTDGAWSTPALSDFTTAVDVRLKMKIRGRSGPGQWYSELFTQTHDNLAGSWDNFELAVVWSDGPLFVGGNDPESIVDKPYLFWEWTEEGGSSEVQNMIRDVGISTRAWHTLRFTQDFANNELKMYREVQYGGDVQTADGLRWEQMGPTYTVASAATIDSGVTEPWAIGYRADVDIEWFEVYDGLDANKIIDIKPENLTAGATSFVDGLGNTWTTTQGAIIKTDEYTPANPADWNPSPISISEALDQLASRVSSLEP